MGLNDCPPGSADCVPTGNGSSVCIPGEPGANPGGMEPGNGMTPGGGSGQGNGMNPGDGTNPVDPGNGADPDGNNPPGNQDQNPIPGNAGMQGPFNGMPSLGGSSAANTGSETFFEPEKDVPQGGGGCACDVNSNDADPMAWLVMIAALFGARRRLRRT